jgi:hypothetical protein
MTSLLIFLERTMVGVDGVPTVEIAVVEREQSASRYEAQGYRRCPYTKFRAAWQLRDQQALARQRASVLTALAEQQEDAVLAVPGGARSLLTGK